MDFNIATFKAVEKKDKKMAEHKKAWFGCVVHVHSGNQANERQYDNTLFTFIVIKTVED